MRHNRIAVVWSKEVGNLSISSRRNFRRITRLAKKKKNRTYLRFNRLGKQVQKDEACHAQLKQLLKNNGTKQKGSYISVQVLLKKHRQLS